MPFILKRVLNNTFSTFTKQEYHNAIKYSFVKKNFMKI